MKITFLYSNGAMFTARSVVSGSFHVAVHKGGQKFVNYAQIKNGLVDGVPEEKDGVSTQRIMSTETWKDVTIDVQKSGLQYVFIADSDSPLGEVLVIPVTNDAKISTEVLADVVSLSL